MKAAIYARYSSEGQREASIEDQVRECTETICRRGWTGAAVYEDKALSGQLGEEQRPGFQAMMDAAKHRAFDVLVVDDSSRLSRDTADALRALSVLDFYGIKFIGRIDGIDTTQNRSRLLFGIKAAMNEEFLRDLAEKTHRGLEGRARQGLSAGGLPYGYRSGPVTGSRGEIVGYRRVIHESEAAIVRRIFEEYASGRSVRAIVTRLNAEGIASPAARWRNKTALQAASWSVTTLRGHRRLAKGVLYNPLYIGQAIWNRSEWRRDPDTRRMTYRVRPKDDWITVEVPELRVVPQDLWDRAQERSRRRTPEAVGLSGRFRHYLLSGFVTCAVCGGAYVVKTPYSYRCGTHHARGATVCANDRPAGRKMLERTVLAALREHLFSAESMAALIAEVRARLLERQRQETDRDAAATRGKALRQLDAEIEHLKAAVLRGKATDTLLEMLEERTRQRETLRAQEPSSALAEALEAVLARLPAAVTETLEALTRSWAAGDVADGKRLLAALGTQIRLQPNGTGLEAHVSGDLERVLRLAVPRGAAGTFNSRAFRWLGEEDSNPR